MKGQAICDIIAQPFNAHIAALATLKERSALVSALAPAQMATILREGIATALEAHGARLEPRTSALMAQWLHEHTRLADRLGESWGPLSQQTAGDVVRGFRAGFSSPEAKAGTALGSLFGGVGSIAGGLVGTFLALHRDDQAFASKLQSHVSEVERWFTTAAADFDVRILPRIERDLNPWPYRLRSVLGVMIALAGLVGAAWLAR